ncbi:Oxidoreductase [Orbilia blumenaviensis]|uniref:Mitochondrial intermembrane space import and assembly protein 40 n=1 Tax=Orbilia blumenaviensis TaxID=1796055 RepID=A0AAV9UN32_9PEZI
MQQFATSHVTILDLARPAGLGARKACPMQMFMWWSDFKAKHRRKFHCGKVFDPTFFRKIPSTTLSLPRNLDPKKKPTKKGGVCQNKVFATEKPVASVRALFDMIQSTVSRSLQRSSRPLLRSATSSLRPTTIQPNTICPHTLSSRSLFTRTRPSTGKRFQGFVARVGLAAAIVYWYNTSTIFAEEPAEKQPFISRAPPVEPIPEERFPTLDEVVAEKKAKAKAAASDATNQSVMAAGELEAGSRSPGSLEEEAGQQGAFNEETGEINWDCPCLGGMAHGPCGEEFREAFSCFIFSKEEPKGVDCIERFKGMQTCFQKYPEIYGEPPSDEQEEEEIDRKLAELDKEKSEAPSKPTSETEPKPSSEAPSSQAPPPKSPPPSGSTPTSSIPHSPPQDRGTDEYSHPPPKDNSEHKAGTLVHPSPGEKGLGGGSHEGPVDTDPNTTGIIRPAPSSSGLENIGGHGAPGVRGVSDPNGPQL